jgi:LuxR family maltose regulon positive regulatory protein
VAAHCAAWTGALCGDQQAVRRWFPVIEAADDAGPLPDGMRSVHSSAALLQACFGFDGIGPMLSAAARAVRLETDPASPWYAAARAMYGTALYFSDELDLAAAQAEEARLSNSAIATVHMQSCVVAALIAVESGRLAQGEELARAARDIATDPHLGLSGIPQSTLADLATGAVLAARGRLTEARGLFEHALDVRRKWAGLSPWPTVEILLRLASVLTDLDERGQAAGLLSEARQVLAALPDGADALLARLARAERHPADKARSVSPSEPLTEREREVLRLLRGTLSLREIGQELYLSQNTIKTHTRAIYRKLDASDRQEAVARASDLGLM